MPETLEDLTAPDLDSLDDTEPALPPPPRWTAHDAARQLLAAGHHVHLVSDGMTGCLNGRCAPGLSLDGTA
ncbi:hypothetical protein [Actinacidiphila acididurans]|uniref:Uncharacterized protein n=1 Tax=Actinacidiphila acididurans TaxID=2784346 RepID=A0ABS2U2Y9_9ACTN|nr:hypothetical protein [Actinacidiphila acididurans]MBM9509969.1 hypothetical protein [Actinacidiphila acididurans]